MDVVRGDDLLLEVLRLREEAAERRRGVDTTLRELLEQLGAQLHLPNGYGGTPGPVEARLHVRGLDHGHLERLAAAAGLRVKMNVFSCSACPEAEGRFGAMEVSFSGVSRLASPQERIEAARAELAAAEAEASQPIGDPDAAA